MNDTYVKILNTIRDNASNIYRERVPEATQTNIETIQAVMTDVNNAVVANEFMSVLLNVLIKQELHAKIFENPLKSLKRGKKPLGDTVEEVYVNFIKGDVHDPKGLDMLNRKLPDVKTVFHRMNRRDKYKITVDEYELAKAFSSYDKLASFINQIIQTLSNSAELDEFVLTKQLFKQALDNNAIKVVYVADPCASEVNGKEFIKTVKTISGDMTFPNSHNNSYLTAQSTDTKAIITLSKKNEQVLILDNATDVSVNVDVLASLFNMSVAQFNDTRKIVIDAFPDPSIRGALVDEKFFQIYDDGIFFKEFENGEGLYKNYWLHVRQTLAYSILVNGVVFKVASDKDSDGEVETFTVTKTLKTGVTSSNKVNSVKEGSSYSTTLKGLVETDTVQVTMGGTDVTTTAYADGKVAITEVTGNIVITVTGTSE